MNTAMDTLLVERILRVKRGWPVSRSIIDPRQVKGHTLLCPCWMVAGFIA